MRVLAEVLFWWAACVGVWLLTLSSVTLPEALAATGCALPCAALAVAARRAVGGSWSPQPRWARWLPPLPIAVVADSARVLAAALPALAGRLPRGEVRTARLAPDRDRGRWNGHQAVATVLVTATPGTVVLDVDDDDGTMLIHALGSGAPSMEEVVRR